MELILIKPIRKVGKIGDQIKVKNGYGRHFLIPNKFAIRATEQNKQLFDEQRIALEEKDRQHFAEAQKIVSAIDGRALIFVRQAAEDGKLFGSVSNKEITHAISESWGENIAVSQIYIPKLVKYTGLYHVEIRLHAEIVANIKISVGRTENEAKEFLKDKNEEQIEENIANLNEAEIKVEEGEHPNEALTKISSKP